MLDKANRMAITREIGEAVDDLVRTLYSDTKDGVSTVQEAEITSRLCQRLEDRLNGKRVGAYKLRVTAQSLPDRGPQSMEKLFGADLFVSISLEGKDGFDKGIFVQAKYDRNVHRDELVDACERMQQIAGKRGAYVWGYKPDGVRVLSSHQVKRMKSNDISEVGPRTMRGFTGRVFDCYAGSKAWGITSEGNRHHAIGDRLRKARAKTILDIQVEKEA